MKQIAAFYHFQSVPETDLEVLALRLEAMGKRHGLRGLMILASEGLNSTIAGLTKEAIENFSAELSADLGFPKLQPKWSEAPAWPFRRFKVKVRSEIVTLGKPEVQPLAPHSKTHLSPQEWNEMMARGDAVLIDTRNWYETRIGKFKGALDPKLDEFHEFSDFVKSTEIPKEKNVMIYCTGGIRCEKAIVEMNNQGFKNVFQLDGGILNYLEKAPNENFEGECFVFDQRVAVDQNLAPSVLYKLCPHCGQPADQDISCNRCDLPAMICITCREKAPYLLTCSKNCANHFRERPGRKGRPQLEAHRFQKKA